MAEFRDRLAVLVDADVKGFVSGMEKAGRAAESELDKADNARARFASRMVSTGGAMVGVAGIMAVGLGKTVQAAQESDLAQRKLANSVRNSKNQASDAVSVYNAQASALQRTTVATDEEVNSAQSLLVQFGLNTREVKQLTPLVVDLGRKMGGDLDGAAKAVGKTLDGNAGALKRQGISLDENRFATDRYGAVIDALRSKVGGFANSEGKSFSGQLERLKNQAGEFQESVGRGVVSVLSDVLPAATSAAQGIGSVDDATGGMIGKLATIATVTTGAVGGVLVLAGGVSKLQQSFGDGALAGKFGTAVKGLTVAGGVVGGVVALATAIDALVDSTTTGTLKIEGASKRSTTRLVADYLAQARAVKDLDDDKRRALEHDYQNKSGQLDSKNASNFKRLAEDNIATARRLYAALSKQPEVAEKYGIKLSELRGILDSETSSQKRANTDTETAARLTQGGTAAKQRASQASEFHKKALEAETTALERQNQATIASFSSEVASLQANQQLQQSIKDKNDALTVTNDTLSAAAARTQQLTDEYEANTGATASNEQKTQFMKQALLELAAQFPQLQPLIAGYIDRLNQIPPEKHTAIFADTGSAASNLQRIIDLKREAGSPVVIPVTGGNMRRFARGGDTRPGETFIAGEDGAEVISSDKSLRVTPLKGRGATTSSLTLSDGSGGDEIHVHVYSVSPDAVLAAIRTARRRNGSRAIKDAAGL